jgi:hypothetical protein
MLTKTKQIINRLRNLRLMEKILLQGLILTVVLISVQLSLESARHSFMSYLPPLGFVFLLLTMYLIQPIIIGVLNILMINILYGTKGWQVGFWLNGIFLLLVFSTFNLVLQTGLSLPFLPHVAFIHVFLLSFPFGLIARFSNGGWNKPID